MDLRDGLRIDKTKPKKVPCRWLGHLQNCTLRHVWFEHYFADFGTLPVLSRVPLTRKPTLNHSLPVPIVHLSPIHQSTRNAARQSLYAHLRAGLSLVVSCTSVQTSNSVMTCHHFIAHQPIWISKSSKSKDGDTNYANIQKVRE